MGVNIFFFLLFFFLDVWRARGDLTTIDQRSRSLVLCSSSGSRRLFLLEMHGRGREEEGERERGTNEVNPRSRGWRIVATGCAVLAAYGVVYLQRPRAMANVVLVNEKLSYGVSKPSSPYQLCLLYRYEIEPAASLAALGTGTRVIWL